MRLTLKNLIFCVCLYLVAGCATFGDMERNLESLKQRDVSVAFDILGYPSIEQKFDYDTVYTWQINQSGVLILPQTSLVTGSIGSTPIQGTVTSSQVTPVNYSCQIKIIADWQRKIKGWDYYGNYGGCRAYMERLKAFRDGQRQ